MYYWFSLFMRAAIYLSSSILVVFSFMASKFFYSAEEILTSHSSSCYLRFLFSLMT